MNDDKTQDDLRIDTDEMDMLDDASRRALLRKLTRIGAVAVPVSIVMLDAKKAASSTGTSPEFGGF